MTQYSTTTKNKTEALAARYVGELNLSHADARKRAEAVIGIAKELIADEPSLFMNPAAAYKLAEEQVDDVLQWEAENECWSERQPVMVATLSVNLVPGGIKICQGDQSIFIGLHRIHEVLLKLRKACRKHRMRRRK